MHSDTPQLNTRLLIQAVSYRKITTKAEVIRLPAEVFVKVNKRREVAESALSLKQRAAKEVFVVSNGTSSLIFWNYNLQNHGVDF
jgi:hypothetical protein